MNRQQSESFPIRDLSLYFDTVSKDRLDHGTRSRRASEWIDLRERMSKLDDQSFTTMMQAFRAMIDREGEKKDATDRPTHGEAQALYDSARDTANAKSHSSLNAVDKV